MSQTDQQNKLLFNNSNFRNFLVPKSITKISQTEKSIWNKLKAIIQKKDELSFSQIFTIWTTKEKESLECKDFSNNVYNLIFDNQNEKIYGTIEYTNNSHYNGEFNKNGKKDGKGVYRFHSGDIYTGNFKDGKFHGEGTCTLNNGDIYTGNFKDGKFNKGKITYSNGIQETKTELHTEKVFRAIYDGDKGEIINLYNYSNKIDIKNINVGDNVYCDKYNGRLIICTTREEQGKIKITDISAGKNTQEIREELHNKEIKIVNLEPKTKYITGDSQPGNVLRNCFINNDGVDKKNKLTK